MTLNCYVNNGGTEHGVSTWSRVRYSNGGPLPSDWIKYYYLSNGGSKKELHLLRTPSKAGSTDVDPASRFR